MWTKTIDWLSSNWGWIAVVGPSVLVGLSSAPSGKGVLDYIKWFLQLVSLLEHKDAPGTFKLPLTARKLPNIPNALVASFLVATTLATLSGCAGWWQSTGKAEVTTAAKCMEGDLLTQWQTLLAQIMAGNIAAVTTVGVDVLNCALLAAQAQATPVNATVATIKQSAHHVASGIIKNELAKRKAAK